MAKTWQVVLATIAIFVAGLVAGGATALGVVKWVSRHQRPMMGAPIGARPGEFGPRLMKSFETELDLTDDQRAKIGPIVKSTSAQLGRERREVQLTTALAIEKMQDQISDLLTAEQRAKFEQLIATQRARLQQFRQQQMQQFPAGNHPPEPGPPK
jgi:Spy/CpxP family protein refolding chaperone